MGVSSTRNGTIAAVSTPWGEGGIGVVRISGPEALAVADRVLRLAGGKRISGLPPRTVAVGRAVAPDGSGLDEVIAFAFHAPNSYTCEDLVEIQGHGGPVVMRGLLQAVLSAGAVMAEPGEFTQRAVVNGRLNLMQAEAVLDLIRAKSGAAAEAALRRLEGRDGRRLIAVEEDVLSLLAEVEAWMDFPEDVPEPQAEMIGGHAREIADDLGRILAGAGRGRLLTEGALVVIAGRPNVGKSSLLNAFLGEERAIVTPRPGTTRDTVAEEISLEGFPIRLVDTAGLAPSADELTGLGMERSRAEMARADLILLVLDAGEPLTQADEDAAAEAASHGAGVIALNKSDLPRRLPQPPSAVSSWPAVSVSAKSGYGLDVLGRVIVDRLGGHCGEGVPALGHLRQIEAAGEARGALEDFLEGLARETPWDMLAEDLRACLSALGRLTGREIGTDLLREIFSRFCVGK